MVTTNTNLNESVVYNERQAKAFFELIKGNLVRFRIPFTIIFINVYNENLTDRKKQIHADKDLENYLQLKIRETDILFNLTGESAWGIILPQSGEKEAEAFIQRIIENVKKDTPNHALEKRLVWAVAEIANPDVDYEELLAMGKQALHQSAEINPRNIEYVRNYKEKKAETVKVSILDSDELFIEVLASAIERTASSHFPIDLKTFKDGDEFINSKWYLSSHRHIVITNEILPRKNGFDVLRMLRSLTNDNRFTIFMVTRRNTEEDMILAYRSGADGYLVRPFSIKLFEAQFQRIMERL